VVFLATGAWDWWGVSITSLGPVFPEFVRVWVVFPIPYTRQASQIPSSLLIPFRSRLKREKKTGLSRVVVKKKENLLVPYIGSYLLAPGLW